MYCYDIFKRRNVIQFPKYNINQFYASDIESSVIDCGIDFLNLFNDICLNIDSDTISSMLYRHGLSQLPQLKNHGLLHLVDGYEIHRIIREHGINAISKLSEVDVLHHLDNFMIVDLVKGTGLPMLFEIEKYQLLNDFELYYAEQIIDEFGIESILALHRTGVLKNLRNYEVLKLLKQYANTAYGVTIIDLLAQNSMLTKLYPFQIIELVEEIGENIVEFLYRNGVDLSVLNNCSKTYKLLVNKSASLLGKLLKYGLLPKTIVDFS